MVLTKDQAKEDIQKIINKYERIKSEGKIKQYNEEMTKKDFILPIFRALGWDVDDSAEVSAEEKVSKGRADYSFRLNNITKFFLEAKKLSENLDDPRWSEQAISYSWHKGVAWAVLCDFEGIKVFNAEYKTDNPVLFDLTYDKYLSNFEQLWLLSKESFQNKAIDIEAEKWKKKPKREKIDKALFEDLTKWRSKLLSSIKKLNSSYTEDEADEAVQRIIARFVFIRVCEDRELEESRLLAVIREDRGAIAKNLRKLFEYYRNKYNSKIFDVHSADKVSIDDNVLTEVIQDLTGSKEAYIKYDFNAINADVLGTIYEQYLGYILKKVGRGVTVAKGKTHRKEMGIYYTPTYIVEYIVKNTVKEYCKDKTLEQISKIKILDPACGSGSFLIKAFDELSAIIKERIKRSEKYDIYDELTPEGELLLGQKIQIACRNIYGVDLDPKAVEIAQLSILLKLLENEGKDHKGGKLLPTILNVRCGNSLIDDSAIAGDKAFKWEGQFKDVFDEGGFDVVIGNPPYGAELNANERKFMSKKFKFSGGYNNTALLFIEKSLDVLDKKGLFGMIVPKSLAFSQRWAAGRKLIKNNLIKVVDASKAFEGVRLEQMIIILDKNLQKNFYILEYIQLGGLIPIDKKVITLTDSIILHGDAEDLNIFNKLNRCTKYFKDITKTCRGLPFQKNLTEEKTPYPIVKGKTISRYNLRLSGEYLPESIIKKNKNRIDLLKKLKIVSQRIVAHVTKPKDHIIIMSALDKEGVLTLDTVENTMSIDKKYSLDFLLCLLNSKLISWYAYRYIFSKAIRTMDLDEYYLGKIPLPCGKIENSIFSNLATKMLSFNKRLNEIGDKKTDERAKIEEEINKTDAEIDELVYKLYEITKEEKKIIEESLK